MKFNVLFLLQELSLRHRKFGWIIQLQVSAVLLNQRLSERKVLCILPAWMFSTLPQWEFHIKGQQTLFTWLQGEELIHYPFNNLPKSGLAMAMRQRLPCVHQIRFLFCLATQLDHSGAEQLNFGK